MNIGIKNEIRKQNTIPKKLLRTYLLFKVCIISFLLIEFIMRKKYKQTFMHRSLSYFEHFANPSDKGPFTF